MTDLRPDSSNLWQTLRLFGACALAYLGGVLIGLPEKYWALITAIVVTQPMLADTLAASRDRIMGTLIGAFAGFFVLELAQHHLPLLPLFWIALLPLAFLVAKRPYLRLSAVTLVVVALVPGTGTPYVRPFDRVVEILLGTFAAIIVAAVIRPRLIKKTAATAEATVETAIE